MKRKIPLILLCIVFLGITGYFGIRLYREWNEYRRGETVYEALTQHVRPEPSSTEEHVAMGQETVPSAFTNTTEYEQELVTESDDANRPTVDFESLQAINPDIIAWIIIEGTNVNYPVVRGKDNSEYLYKLVDGSSNSAGSVFMDYRNRPDFTGRNTVLYGHHMKNDTMFAPITNYKEQSFYDEHPTCLILTPAGNYRLEFFAGYVASMNSDAWKLEFESDDEYGAWLEQSVAHSTFQSKICPTPRDRVVTLSTCSYEYDDARYVLLGILTVQN